MLPTGKLRFNFAALLPRFVNQVSQLRHDEFVHRQVDRRR